MKWDHTHGCDEVTKIENDPKQEAAVTTLNTQDKI
jgi:hypothetical protein